MALREKFGRLVLLEETDVSTLSREFRAARLGPGGLDRLVTLTCFAPAVSSHAAATKRLMDEARLAARLQNAGLVRVLGIGRVDQTFYVSTELVEGRTVAAVLERCARDAFPFAADHALMIASRAASALEYLHAKKDDGGRTLFHGLLAPSRLVVAYDGEVKIKGLGLWPALRETPLLDEAERLRLAPEQAEGGPGDTRSDVYALALLLLEALTGTVPPDPLSSLATARITSVSGESLPLPKPLAELLCRALARDPLSRFGGIAEMRKAIDTLLFSGDFTPTTFDLAFFMHTIFREEMDRETREIEEARRADYREFLEDKTTVKPAAVAAPVSATVPPSASFPGPAPAPPIAGAPADAGVPVPTVASTPVVEPTAAAAAPASAPAAAEPVAAEPVPPRPAAVAAPAAAPEPLVTREPAPRPARDSRAHDAAAGLTLGSAAAPSRSRAGLWIALGLVGVVAAGGAAWVFTHRSPSPATTPVTTLSPEATAALARVKQLEDRIAQLERERTEAEAKAAEEAKKKLEAQAAAKGRVVDAAAVQRAQEEARARARAEQETKQQEELARLAEARKAEEKRIAEASPPPTPAAASTPATTSGVPSAPVSSTDGASPAAALQTPTSSVAPASTASAAPASVVPTPVITATPAAAATPLVSEPSNENARIVPPTLTTQTPPRYPPLAQQRGIEGTVELTALVDESGSVTEVRVTRVAPARMGFEEASIQHVRSRHYKPGTRNGTPIRMVVPILVKFKPR